MKTTNKKSKTYTDIFLFILRKGKTTRREIQAALNLSWGTVSGRVSDLIEDRFVIETESLSKGVGRNAYYLTPSPNIVSVGVDFNASGLTGSVLSLDGKTLKSFSVDFASSSKEEAIDQIVGITQEAVEWADGAYKVYSIGLSLQGGVDGVNGMFNNFYFIDGWEAVPIKKIIEDRFGYETVIMNDGEAIIKDYERKFSKESTKTDLVVRLVDGIGFSFTNFQGANSPFRSDFGHMIMVPGGHECICGKHGCLEAYSSIRGMAERAGLGRRHTHELLEHKEKYMQTILEGARYLAIGIINVISGFEVQNIVITGTIDELCPEFIEELQREYDAHIGLIEPRIKIGVVTSISPSSGAALLSAERTNGNDRS